MENDTTGKGALGLPTQTGVKVIDTGVYKIVQWEESVLSNPILQVTILAFAGYGIYKLVFSK